MTQIRLFGGVAAVADDGRMIDLGPAKCQAVLASLALSPGSAVPVDRLVTQVWGESAPRTADKTLQSYVTRLRKGLGQASIARVGTAYRLNVDPSAVDVVRFQQLLDEGNSPEALAEWVAAPLAGLDAPGLDPVVQALTERWLGALEADLSDHIETDPPGAISTLTELTAQHPFREGLWALLMTALYQMGRQAEALAAYRRARAHLVEHLGVEPGPRLRDLEASILGQDEELTVDRSSKGGPLGLPTGTVTFGFSDVVDSTVCWASHRGAMAQAMDRHDHIVRSAVDRHGGAIFATGGDSFGVAFHRASDAARWADELQDRMRAERWPEPLELAVRVGLHTGETEERGKGYFGPAVIVAAKLSSVGHRHQTLLSSATAALLEERALQDLGRFRLDGVVREQRVFQLGDDEHPALRIEQRRRGNLPARLGSLFGREDAVASVLASLDDRSLVTLVGPGGIGKTRLALAAATARLGSAVDEVWVVELAGFSAGSDVPRAVATVLDVRQVQGRTVLDSIVSSLHGRRALIVLDNCEHVIGGAALVAEAIVNGSAQASVLATSREGLGLPSEQLIAVSPLEPETSGVELFNERALAAAPQFDVAAERSAVAEICRKLDGVPLAIELAAARILTLDPHELVDRLDDRLRLLTGGRRGSVERHRTLRATIQWSYDLLDAHEQRLLHRLSVFAGPFDLAGADAVAGSGTAGGLDDVDAALSGLVEQSMVIVESGSFGRSFRLLETMRQFAAERLTDDNETDTAAQHHARWCLANVALVQGLLGSAREFEGVARLDELWPNLRAAFGWACSTGDLQLARKLMEPISTEIYARSRNEVGDWAEQLLSHAAAEDQELREFGLTWAARRYMRNMDLEGYEHLVGRFGEPDIPMLRFARAFIDGDHRARLVASHEALADFRAGDDQYQADLFEIAGHAMTLLMSGDADGATEVLHAALARHRVGGPPTCVHWALTSLGYAALSRGDVEEAYDMFDQAAAVVVPERTNSLNNPLASRIALRRGNLHEATVLLRAHVEDLLEQDNMYLVTTAEAEFITLAAATDRLEDAAMVIGHLGQGRGVANAAFRTLLSPELQSTGIASDDRHRQHRLTGESMSDHEVLVHVRHVLDDMLAKV